MDTTLLGLLLIAMIIVLGALIVVLYIQLRKLQDNLGDSTADMQYLAQSSQQGQMQAAALSEKLDRIETVTEAVSKAEIELRGLTERVATMEQSQTVANQGISYLSNSLTQIDTSIRSEFNKGQQQIMNTLYQIGTRLDAQISKVEQETGSSFAELRTLTNSLIDAASSTRPDRGNGHQQSLATVNQIGPRLASEIPQFQQSAGVELAELRTLAMGISEAIASARSELSRAKDDLTEIQNSLKAGTEIEQRTTQSIDLQKVSGYIEVAQENFKELQEGIDERFSRAIPMPNNSRDELRAPVSKLGGELTGLPINASPSAAVLGPPMAIDTQCEMREDDLAVAQEPRKRMVI